MRLSDLIDICPTTQISDTDLQSTIAKRMQEFSSNAKCSGIMGVPITFLDKYNPDQFEILGMAASAGYNKEIVGLEFLGNKDARPLINGKNTYARVFIKRRKQ